VLQHVQCKICTLTRLFFPKTTKKVQEFLETFLEIFLYVNFCTTVSTVIKDAYYGVNHYDVSQILYIFLFSPLISQTLLFFRSGFE
jgi:hypothetical protein